MAETGHRAELSALQFAPPAAAASSCLTCLVLPAIARHVTQSSVEGGRRGLQ